MMVRFVPAKALCAYKIVLLTLARALWVGRLAKFMRLIDTFQLNYCYSYYK